MKLLCQALSAATVDTFGVVCVVWLILGTPLLGYHTFQSLRESRSGFSTTWNEAVPAAIKSTPWRHSGDASDAAVSIASGSDRSSRGLLPHAAVWVVAPRRWMH
jgi:hypothetical protein